MEASGQVKAGLGEVAVDIVQTAERHGSEQQALQQLEGADEAERRPLAGRLHDITMRS